MPKESVPLPLAAPSPEDVPELKDRAQVLADLYRRLGQAKDKEQADRITAAIERLWMNSGSATVDLLISRATALQDSGNIPGALELLDGAARLDASNPEIYNRRAFVYFSQQDYPRALADLRQVLARDPKHFRAINGLAQILKEYGDKAGALKALRMMLAINPFAEGADTLLKELERDVEGQPI